MGATGSAAVTLTVLVATAGVATAAPAQEADRVRVTRFDSKTLRAAEIDAQALSSLPSGASGARKNRVQEHLTDAARAGRLVDERAVHVTTVPDPYARDTDITLVWDGAKAPESMTYAQNQLGTEEETAVAVGIQYGGESTPIRTLRTRRAEGGSGYGAGFNVRNMYKEDNGCATTWFVPKFPHTRDHKIVSCYEVWAQDRTVHFIYNRWALWTPAAHSLGVGVRTHDFYVAARPWRGHESKLVRLNDWAPRAPNQTCDNNQNFTLGGGYGGVTGTVSFPINVCQNYWLDINSNTRKIGIDFDGVRAGQMYMDVAGDYNAVNATVLPIWADYNWMEVRPLCSQACPSPEYWVAKDSGW
jgi:hypothetical protein